MDGVHDLGGMQGFGPVEREENEPVFHAAWEAAVLAMMRAGGARGLFNIDEFRHGIERMAPPTTCGATYYEKWLDGIARLLVEKGVVSAAELAERARRSSSARPDAPATAAAHRAAAAARARPTPEWAQDVDPRDRRRARASRPAIRCVTREHPPARAHAAAALRARQARA